MTEQDLVIQDLKAENAKLKEQLKEQSKSTTIKILESKKKGFKDCISKQEVQLNREWNKAIEACIEAVKAGADNG